MTVISLPLFPLRTVLFPNMSLPLHVFEDRYKLMLNSCMEEGRPFGVVLADFDEETDSQSVPHPVGTVARITDWKQLDDGQAVVMTKGEHRFRILDYLDTDEPYLVGAVEHWEDEVLEPNDVASLIQEVDAGLVAYLTLVMLLSDVALPASYLAIPRDPSTLSFHVASQLQIDLGEKQQLLENSSVTDRLRRELALLRREHDFLHRLVNLQGTIFDADEQWEKIDTQRSMLGDW